MPNEGNAPPIIDFQVYLSSLITTCTNIQRVTKFFESFIFPIFKIAIPKVFPARHILASRKKKISQTCSSTFSIISIKINYTKHFPLIFLEIQHRKEKYKFRPIDFHPTTLLIFQDRF